MKEKNTPIASAMNLIKDIKQIIETGRATAYSTVNATMIATY